MAKIGKIIIVGGGSSGWMTAASLLKNFPSMDLTLIESSDIPTIGVGESTIGSINDYLIDLGLKDEDWMEYCNATYKTSIDFTNFRGDGSRVKYPFGNATWLNKYSSLDWFIKKALNSNESKYEYIDFALGSSELLRNNKLTKDSDSFRGWNFDLDTAYHMDASLFGDYLKKNYCLPRGMTHIVDDVISVSQDDSGNVSNIKTKGGKTLVSDIFIDCTGFKSLLLTETLGEPFVSFKDKLINDKAVAIRIPYVDKEIEMEHSTNATTLSSGWVWNIPLWDRIGTGYVYSSQFMTPEDAEKEFKDYLVNDRDVKHSQEEIDSIKAFHVDIKPGLHERNWVKNVVAIGLSNGFIEPLESTGLMLTHLTIFELVKTLQRRNGRVNGYDKSIFNIAIRDTMNKFSGFIAAHFALAERDDTPYWKYVTEDLDYTDNESNEWLTLTNYIPRTVSGIEYNWSSIGQLDGLPYIMDGFGYNPMSKYDVELRYSKDLPELKKYLNGIDAELDIELKSNQKAIKHTLSHYAFLKKHIYKEII
jgi:tryptophan halogenase